MKVAVIGCGGVSKMHFNALSADRRIQITAVADIKKDRADHMASQYGATAYYDFDKLIENEHLDCIHICTPHYLHTPMAIKALEKGINVLTEKPCSVSSEEIALLCDAQKKSGKQVGVCFQNRYNNCVRQVLDVIGNGSLGSVRSIRAFVTWSRGKEYYSDDWHGTVSKECGGVLINQAIHTIDLIQLFGGKCQKVTAHTSNDHLKGIIEVEDNASVLMTLENGVTAILYATTAYAENSDVFIEVAFEKGILRLEGENLYSVNGGKLTEIFLKDDTVHEGQSYWGSGHASLIKDFYDCLEEGRKFSIDAFEGGHAAKIVAAAYKSSESGETIDIR